jgi:hypothetical protein
MTPPARCTVERQITGLDLRRRTALRRAACRGDNLSCFVEIDYTSSPRRRNVRRAQVLRKHAKLRAAIKRALDERLMRPRLRRDA